MTSASGSHPPPRRFCVLIVDDDPRILKAIADGLERSLGWQTLTADGPAAALGLYARADVVLSDWEMPDGGGARVIAESRKPVLIHSARAGELGYPHCVGKPSSISEIHEALLALIAKSP